MLKHFGRIALGSILNQWSENHPANPRFLASEVAGTLRSLAPETHPIGARDAGVYQDGQAQRAPDTHITFGALADYFESASTGRPASTLDTNGGPVSTSNVLIWQHWIDLIASEAAKRMGHVETLANPANSSYSVALTANDLAPATRHSAPEALPSGSSPGYLKIYQAHLRKEGERSAAEQLDEAQQQVQFLTSENKCLRSERGALRASVALLREEGVLNRRELSEAVRARLKASGETDELKAELAQHAGITEFMNPNNPLSPLEGRRMVSAWCELTEDGTSDVVSETGRGLHDLCKSWLKRNFGEPAAIVVKRFTSALAWPARKNGGAIAKRKAKKG